MKNLSNLLANKFNPQVQTKFASYANICGSISEIMNMWFRLINYESNNIEYITGYNKYDSILKKMELLKQAERSIFIWN